MSHPEPPPTATRTLVSAFTAVLTLLGALLALPMSAALAVDEGEETQTHRMSHPLDDATLIREQGSAPSGCIDAFDPEDNSLLIDGEAFAGFLFRNVVFGTDIVITNASLLVTSAEDISNTHGSEHLTFYAGPRAPAGELTPATAPGCSGLPSDTDVVRHLPVPSFWPEGQELTIDITLLVNDLRASDAWQDGMDLAIAVRDGLGHFEDLGLKWSSSEGSSPAELDVTWYQVSPENALNGPPPALTPGLGAAIPEPGTGDWYNVWTLNVHRITVFEDGDLIGPGDIYVMAHPWGLGTSNGGVGVFCWPADTFSAPIRTALRDLGGSGPNGEPVFEIPCPVDDVWHIGNNESVAFSPPLSTTAFALPSSPIEEVMWADCLPPGFFYVGEEDINLSLSNPHQHLDTVGWRSGGEYVSFLADPDRCHVSPGERVTSTGVNGKVEIEYSFDLERFETVDISWGVYLIGYEGLAASVDWTLGWWPNAAAGNTNIETSGSATLPYPARATSVEATGSRCIPLEIRSPGLVADAPCLEPGTYTATHHNIAPSDGSSTSNGGPELHFMLIKFAVGVVPPSCLQCQPTLPPWSWLSASAVTALAALILFTKPTAFARVGGSLFAAAALISAGVFAVTWTSPPTAGAGTAAANGADTHRNAVQEPIVFARGAPEEAAVAAAAPNTAGSGGNPPAIPSTIPTSPQDSLTTTAARPDPTTTSELKGTTTSSAPKKTTTSTSPETSSTTNTTLDPTTTTQPKDTTGPKVTGVDANPDTLFTSGNPPDTSTIAATVSDQSGVQGVVLHYRQGKAPFAVWNPMVLGRDGKYSVHFGPFPTVGTYEFRIVATDELGNANCSSRNVASCPGGLVEVILP